MDMFVSTMVLGAFFFSTTAEAGDKVKQADREVQYRKVTEHIFGDLKLSAVAGKAGIDLIHEPPPMKFNPLIRLRSDFNNEVRWSVNEVQ
jgi:hypothetical protein